eukprot:m.246374 g.246374  ORF g.246374 m.246374 type:complete len:1365 (-) comp17152_c1_seq2:996-5090(-)
MDGDQDVPGTSQASFKIDLPKFSGKAGTYHGWSIRMKMALRMRGQDIWATVEPGTRPAGAAARRKFDADDLVACNIIASTLSGHALLLFTDADSDNLRAADGWKRLRNFYASQDRLRIATLKQQQVSVPTSNLDKFFERQIEIQQELQAAGVKQDDEEVFTIVWRQLPRWSDALCLSYLTTKQFPTLQELHIRVMQLKDKCSAQPSRPEAGAFATSAQRGRYRRKQGQHQHQQQRPQQQVSRTRFNGNCHYCGKRGHRASECRKQQRDTATSFIAGTATIAAHSQQQDSLTWIADTGATHHMACTLDAFEEFTETLQQGQPSHITTFGGDTVPVQGVGTVCLTIRTADGGTTHIKLIECLYVPGGHTNLMSLGRLVMGKQGPTGHAHHDSSDGHFIILCSGARIKLRRQGHLRLLPTVAPCATAATATPSNPTADVVPAASIARLSMHDVLGHRNDKDVEAYCKLMGITDQHPKSMKDCVSCAISKSTRQSVNKSAERTSVPGQRLHADIVEWPEVSLTGKRYSLLIMDEATRYAHIYHMDRKSDALHAFTVFFETDNNFPTSPTFTCLQTDSDVIFMSGDFKKLTRQHVQRQQYSPPYTQAQNGLVERHVRTISDMVRTMLHATQLPGSYWSLAANHAVYLINHLPRSSLDDRTPSQVLTGRTPHRPPELHVFGQPAVVHIHTHRSRLDPRGRQGIYVGHNPNSTSHLVYFADTKKVVSAKHVRFMPLPVITPAQGFLDEHDVPMGEGETEETDPPIVPPLLPPNVPTSSAATMPTNNAAPLTADVDDVDDPLLTNESSPIDDTDFLLTDFDSMTPAAHVAAADLAEPTTIRQAMSGPNSDKWAAACRDEIHALERNGVLQLLPRDELPADTRPLKSKFVFKIKRDAAGAVTRYKARWVAKGYTQRPGVDYHETYSPTPNIKTILTVLAASVQRRHYLHQLDFKSAFLQADLEEMIYMELPANFHEVCPEWQGRNAVCRLLKPLYGLKQAGRAWTKKLHTWLRGTGWTQSNIDSCLFSRRTPTDVMWVVTYVDDLIVSSTDESSIAEFKSNVMQQFEAEDIGPLKWYLGMKIDYDRDAGRMHISQSQAIDDIVQQFKMDSSATVATPMQVGFDPSNTTDNPDATLPYRSLVGSLLYLSNRSRPDIAYAVGVLCRYMDRYTRDHWLAAKHVVRYLKGTRTSGIVYERRADVAQPLSIECFSDASFGTDALTGRSTTGFTCFIHGCLVSWNSRLQPTVALSTAEAEYMAISAAAQDVQFLVQLLEDVGEQLELPVVINTDNQPAIRIGTDKATKPRSKHIRVRHHYIRELVDEGNLTLQHCPGTRMIADALTKPLARQLFCQHGQHLIVLRVNRTHTTALHKLVE